MWGFFLGVVFACGGVAMIYFANAMQNAFGKIEWMEKTFGSSVVWYQVMWFVLMIVGFLYMLRII